MAFFLPDFLLHLVACRRESRSETAASSVSHPRVGPGGCRGVRWIHGRGRGGSGRAPSQEACRRQWNTLAVDLERTVAARAHTGHGCVRALPRLPSLPSPGTTNSQSWPSFYVDRCGSGGSPDLPWWNSRAPTWHFGGSPSYVKEEEGGGGGKRWCACVVML